MLTYTYVTAQVSGHSTDQKTGIYGCSQRGDLSTVWLTASKRIAPTANWPSHIYRARQVLPLVPLPWDARSPYSTTNFLNDTEPYVDSWGLAKHLASSLRCTV